MTLDVIFPKVIKKPQAGQPIQNIIQEGVKAAQCNNISPKQQQHMLQQSAISHNINSLSSSTESLPSNFEVKDGTYSVDGYKDDELMWYDQHSFL